MSTALLAFCSENDVTISFLSENGRFQGRLCGPVSGNVLLRKRQYAAVEDRDFSERFVRDLLFCKIKNSKNVLMRHARTSSSDKKRSELLNASHVLSELARQLDEAESIDSMRGIEGAAASVYYAQLDNVLESPKGYTFEHRSRRPPENEVNAVLSFLYTMLAHDVSSALESVGLDPAVGHLHTLRPGRASFALDLMEELRAPLCDRLALTMFNKGQLSEQDFAQDSLAIYLSDKGRRKVLEQWRLRKKESIQHPFLNEKINIGMIPFTQAMLFARLLRGDLDRYPPFVWR